MQGLGLPAPPWIVGHRGVRGGVPENTVASVREAVAQQADMVELDLQLTGDGALVAHHDEAVRISEEESLQVGRATLAALRRGSARAADARWGRAGAIPTLGEVLAAAPPDLPLNLDIKRYDTGVDPGPLIEALARAIAGRPRTLVSSFDWPLLDRVRGRLPAVAVAPLGGRTASWDELLATARRLGAFSIHLHRLLAARLGRCRRLEEAAAAGLPVLAYTVNRRREARRLLRHGVSGLFTDQPAALRAWLEDDGWPPSPATTGC